MKHFFNIIILILCVFAFSGCDEQSSNQNPYLENRPTVSCEERQWKHPSERMECLFPDPPIGRWHAVYSAEFAERHNLPKENISTDLSPGVDYMEMEVVPFGRDNIGTGCFVSFLMQQPHDIAVFSNTKNQQQFFSENKKVFRFFDLNNRRNDLLRSRSFSFISRDYNYDKDQGFFTTTLAFQKQNVLKNYDVFSVNAGCKTLSMNADSYYPDGYGFRAERASLYQNDSLWEKVGKARKLKNHVPNHEIFFIIYF